MEISVRRWSSAPSITRRGYNEGIEFKAKFTSGNFQAYGNFAVAQQRATDVASNQYLFDNTTPLPDLGGLTEFQYIQSTISTPIIPRFVTGSAGASYLWNGTRSSAICSTAAGCAAATPISPCTALCPVQRGLTHEFTGFNMQPLTLRFDVVNIFDTLYQIRSGTGIGVFAAQYGPRRGLFCRTLAEILMRRAACACGRDSVSFRCRHMLCGWT